MFEGFGNSGGFDWNSMLGNYANRSQLGSVLYGVMQDGIKKRNAMPTLDAYDEATDGPVDLNSKSPWNNEQTTYRPYDQQVTPIGLQNISVTQPLLAPQQPSQEPSQEQSPAHQMGMKYLMSSGY